VPATAALESREPIFVSSPDDRDARFPQFDHSLTHAAFIVIPVAVDDDAGVLSFGFSRPRVFTDEDRQYLEVVSTAFAHALRRAALFEAEHSSRDRLRTVLEFSEALASLEEPDDVLRTTAQFAATRIGRDAVVYAREPDGNLRRIAIAHRDPDIERRLIARATQAGSIPEIVDKVAETGIGVSSSDVAEGDDVYRPTSELIVPIRTASRTHGVLVIGDDRPLPLGALELELANDFGRRAGSATERTRLWQASQRQRAIDQRIVEVLQGAIVPDRLPRFEGIELAASYHPADVFVDVGGDWYDAFDIEGGLLLMVGDVAGHGLEAATLMGRTRNALRAYAVEDHDPAELLRRSHEMLYSLEPGSMVTAVVACFDPERRRLTYARAGHPPPLLSDSHGTRFLDAVNSTPLGTLSGRYDSTWLDLEPGALVVLYTDGLIERRHRSIDVGLDQLLATVDAVARKSCRDVCHDVLSTFTADRAAEDDICVLVMRVP
jgi:serine phosphatase RsbU (regulator of sigma subunit)